MREFIQTYWPFMGMALTALIGFVIGRLSAPRWLLDDGADEPQPWEYEEHDLTEGEEEEVDRIKGGFGEQVYIAISPLVKFRDPLGIAATVWDTAIVPVVDDTPTNGSGKLGFWGTMEMVKLLVFTRPTMDMNPYRGRHRTDGMTKKEKDNVNTTTTLIPILQHLLPDGLTMEIPRIGSELVYA